jgi:hypothetical protein
MRRFFSLLVVCFAMTATNAGVADAQSAPDLRGSWIGTGKTIVSGPAPHHRDNPAARPAGSHRLSEMKFTITVEGQQDMRFWGTIASAAKTEPVIGAIAADGKRFRIVLQDSGVLDGVMLSNDSFEVFYVDIKPGLTAVGTNLYTRQK